MNVFLFFYHYYVELNFVFCVIQLAQSKLSFLATAGATPVVSVLTSSRKESSGLMIVGPEGG